MRNAFKSERELKVLCFCGGICCSFSLAVCDVTLPLYFPQAKAIAQPFAYEEYRKEKIRKRIEEARTNRIRQKV